MVIASPRAGGALDARLAPHGGRVYTISFETRIGTTVLQFADPSSSPGFDADLVAPQAIRTEIPGGLEVPHTVVAGIIDRLGALRQLRVLQADKPELAAKLIEALRQWRFRPVLRRDVAIDVDAVLGFGVTTR